METRPFDKTLKELWDEHGECVAESDADGAWGETIYVVKGIAPDQEEAYGYYHQDDPDLPGEAVTFDAQDPIWRLYIPTKMVKVKLCRPFFLGLSRHETNGYFPAVCTESFMPREIWEKNFKYTCVLYWEEREFEIPEEHMPKEWVELFKQGETV